MRQSNIGLLLVGSLSESESKVVLLFVRAVLLAHRKMGRCRMMVSPSKFWYSVAGVAVAGGCLMVPVGAVS